MQVALVVRFGYGSAVPWVHPQKDGTLRAIAGPGQVVLRTPVDVRGEDLKSVSEFAVGAGETIPSSSLTLLRIWRPLIQLMRSRP
jgi:hypothetical protein